MLGATCIHTHHDQAQIDEFDERAKEFSKAEQTNNELSAQIQSLMAELASQKGAIQSLL
eukprot:COSAG01_NODE_8859_length_2634_cov_2.226735_4_plen_59_part_00